MNRYFTLDFSARSAVQKFVETLDKLKEEHQVIREEDDSCDIRSKMNTLITIMSPENICKWNNVDQTQDYLKALFKYVSFELFSLFPSPTLWMGLFQQEVVYFRYSVTLAIH